MIHLKKLLTNHFKDNRKNTYDHQKWSTFIIKKNSIEIVENIRYGSTTSCNAVHR